MEALLDALNYAQRHIRPINGLNWTVIMRRAWRYVYLLHLMMRPDVSRSVAVVAATVIHQTRVRNDVDCDRHTGLAVSSPERAGWGGTGRRERRQVECIVTSTRGSGVDLAILSFICHRTTWMTSPLSSRYTNVINVSSKTSKPLLLCGMKGSPYCPPKFIL